MGKQGAFGSKLKITVSSTLTVVAGLLDVGDFTKMKNLVDMTGHDATGGWSEFVDDGGRSVSAFSVTLGWDDADTTHAAIETAFDAKTPVAMSLEDPAGSEVFSFSAHIASISRQYKTKNGYKAVVSIQPTGAITKA